MKRLECANYGKGARARVSVGVHPAPRSAPRPRGHVVETSGYQLVKQEPATAGGPVTDTVSRCQVVVGAGSHNCPDHHHTQLHVTLSDGHRQRSTPTAATQCHLYNSNKKNIGGNPLDQDPHSRGVGWKSSVRVSVSTGGSSVFTLRDTLKITQGSHRK